MDLISRQAVIDTATEYEKELREILGDNNELAETVKILKHRIIALQPAQPDDRLAKIADLVEGTIDHFDLDDAMDLLYQIKKEVLK